MMQPNALTVTAGGLLLSGALAGCSDRYHVLGNVGLAGHAVGDMALILEVTPEFENQEGAEDLDSWLLVANIGHEQAALAGSGMRLVDGTTQRGAYGIAGAGVTVGGHATTLHPGLLWLGWQEHVEFSAIALSVGEDDAITGRATGKWSKEDAFGLHQSSFSASVVARADDEPPIVSMKAGPVILPHANDDLTVYPSEPIVGPESDGYHLRVTNESGEIVPSHWGLGFPASEAALFTSYTWELDGDWPVGETLNVQLLDIQDWTGNAAAVTDLGSLRIAEPLDSPANFDFEAGLDGWIPQYRGTQVEAVCSYEIPNLDDGSGQPLRILPPHGHKMAVIPPWGRLAGYLAAPHGGELCASVGIITSRLSEIDDPSYSPYSVGLWNESSGSEASGSISDYTPFAYPKSGWSGFSEQCMPLNGDGWLTIAGESSEPDWERTDSRVPHILLIDNLYYR